MVYKAKKGPQYDFTKKGIFFPKIPSPAYKPLGIRLLEQTFAQQFILLL